MEQIASAVPNLRDKFSLNLFFFFPTFISLFFDFEKGFVFLDAKQSTIGNKFVEKTILLSSSNNIYIRFPYK